MRRSERPLVDVAKLWPYVYLAVHEFQSHWIPDSFRSVWITPLTRRLPELLYEFTE